MALIFSLVVLLVLAAPLFALHYLFRLPEAPACPACRRVTAAHERRPGAAGDRLRVLLPATQVRRCTGCGWQGRMRWRWALQREGSGRPGGTPR